MELRVKAKLSNIWVFLGQLGRYVTRRVVTFAWKLPLKTFCKSVLKDIALVTIIKPLLVGCKRHC